MSNTAKSGANSMKKKGKPRGKPFASGKGEQRDPRINGNGRPANSQSWSEQFHMVGEMKVEEVLDIVGNDSEIGAKVSSLPKNIQMKTLLAIANVVDATINPSQGRVLQQILDRLEGRAGDKGISNNKSDDRSVLPSLPAELLAPDFLESYRAILSGEYDEFWEFGGRGSTKSTFISIVIIYLLLNNPDMHVMVVRQVAETLRTSVFAQLQWAINALNLSDDFKCTVSPLEIVYKPTGQTIYFRGASDPTTIKSVKPPFGYIGILWIEELDQIKGSEAVRSIEQSVLRGGDLESRSYKFKSFNPPKSSMSWVNKEIIIPKPKRWVHKSDYRTVPKNWLGRTFIDDAEHLKEVNPKAYEHEYLGIANGNGGMIFDNVEVRPITDDEIAKFETSLQGQDFGWYPDPLAWVRMHYDPARLTLYIYDEYRANKTSNQDVYEALVKEKSVTPNDCIIADSASPKDIADFVNMGLYMIGCEKGKDSLKYSYKWLQSLKAIVIDSARAPETAKEFTEAEFERDKNGEIITTYPDKNNHSIDAVRYGTNLIWRNGGE